MHTVKIHRTCRDGTGKRIQLIIASDPSDVKATKHAGNKIIVVTISYVYITVRLGSYRRMSLTNKVLVFGR